MTRENKTSSRKGTNTIRFSHLKEHTEPDGVGLVLLSMLSKEVEQVVHE